MSYVGRSGTKQLWRSVGGRSPRDKRAWPGSSTPGAVRCARVGVKVRKLDTSFAVVCYSRGVIENVEQDYVWS